MASLCLHDASVKYPIYDASHRSLLNMFISGSSLNDGRRISRKTININALNSITVNLSPGDRVAVFGYNGSGKSTLIRVLSGLLKPTDGDVTINGNPAPILNIGFGYDSEATIPDTIKLKGILDGYGGEDVRALIQKVADFTSLETSFHLPLKILPAGHLFRFAIALAFFSRSDIFLFDEVLETVDQDYLERVKTFIKQSFPEEGIIVMAERSRSVLEGLCNKALVLDGGRLIAFEDFKTVMSRWGDQYTF